MNLQALADSSVKDDAGSSVKVLSDSISKLNKQIGEEELLSDEQKQQIGASADWQLTALILQKLKRPWRGMPKLSAHNSATRKYS